MVSGIKNGSAAAQNPGEVNSITLETTSGDMLVKHDGAVETASEPGTNPARASSFAADEKGALKLEANLRRMVIEQDLNQPPMAVAGGYQHNQTDLESLKRKKPEEK